REASRLRSERASSAALISTLKQRDDLTAEIAAQGGELALVLYSPDGRRMAIGGKRGDTRIVDARDGKSVADLPAPATLAAFSPDGNAIVTSDGKMVRLWDAGKGTLLAAIPTGKGAVQALAFQADGRAAAAALVERGSSTLVFWDLAAKQVSRRLPLPGMEV